MDKWKEKDSNICVLVAGVTIVVATIVTVSTTITSVINAFSAGRGGHDDTDGWGYGGGSCGSGFGD